MNYVVLMETGHAHQNLPGQSDDVFLCEGLVVISNTLVKNFTSGSTEREKKRDGYNIDLKLCSHILHGPLDGSKLKLCYIV